MSRRGKVNYFQTSEGAPSPLSITVERQVRYEEVDAIGVVWHGRYVSFLEDGRAGFFERYGLGYLTMHENKMMAPFVQMHIEYIKPLRLSEKFLFTAELFWSESIRMNFQYRIINQQGAINASAYTVQILTDDKFEVQLSRPRLFEEFCEKWKRGLLS